MLCVPLMENEASVDSMPTLLTPPTLEVVLQGLHESEIRGGIQNEPPAGGITAWIDFGSQTEKATFYGTIVGDRQVWPAADRMASWLHETAVRLFPESMPKNTAVDRQARALCIGLARVAGVRHFSGLQSVV
jgi:hypothetical protein